jgi:hypothetical protein
MLNSAVRQHILWFSVRVLGALGVMRLSVGWFGNLRSEDHRVALILNRVFSNSRLVVGRFFVVRADLQRVGWRRSVWQ